MINKNKILKLKKLKKILLIICCITSLPIMSIAYAAYINVTQVGTVGKIFKPELEIAIKSVVNTYGCGYEMRDIEYADESISVNVELPDLDCSVFYEIEIVNNKNESMQLVDIVDQYNENENIIFTLLGFEKGYFLLAKETLTIMMEIKYKSSLSVVPDNKIYNGIIEFTWKTLDPMQLAARVIYDKVSYTDKSVLAKITFNQKDVIILNNNGNEEYMFDQNGEFVFEYKDINETISTLNAQVSWINKERE